jgi:hypothetical protein
MTIDDALSMADAVARWAASPETDVTERCAKRGEALVALAAEVRRLREAISGVRWPRGEDGEHCPWCDNQRREGHGQWMEGPCPMKEEGR